jgi:hypothetical protein
MNKKIPHDAFSFYVSLGPSRSYDAVAEKYGASKRGVADHAKRERWQQRIEQVESRARESADSKAQESIEEMNARHLRESKFLQSKAIEGLKSGRLELVASCGKAMTSAIQLERLIRGQATERTENVEQIVKREYERWLVPVERDVERAPQPEPDAVEESDADAAA